MRPFFSIAGTESCAARKRSSLMLTESYFPLPISEVELHTQLDVSRRVALWTGDKAKGRAGHVRVGARENMPVEGIERREPKLEVALLPNMEVLQQRDVFVD